jgi:hypothetical protein
MSTRRLFVFAVIPLVSCAEPAPPPPPPAEHATTVEEWSVEREAKLRQPDGWLSLIGLYWLHAGPNTFGADSANDFVYAPLHIDVPARIGTFVVDGERVRFDADPAAVVDGEAGRVSSIEMAAGDSATLLRAGPIEWFVIRRDDRLAIRARDTLSIVRTGFRGIERFPVRLDWRFAARFIVHDPPDTIDVPNILGTLGRTPSPGTVVFEHDGREYELVMWKDSDDPANFFTAFADQSNGTATYGGGRFLWVDAPDENGWTVVDFNQSYNPPCVFTDFATCPLPPRQNRLPFVIEAGEKMYAGSH